MVEILGFFMFVVVCVIIGAIVDFIVLQVDKHRNRNSN